ncbi:hypothetical protein KUA00_03735 [Proteus mirabilis]|uniref:hypothetical protein n=1 Tax=Proteus mirabilis TaxID=584 RepID=UPI00218221EE|nr:hypothetical protein [Proteus mirabilis]MCT0124124.1 hypothetical protein [Proteus mirabilis]
MRDYGKVSPQFWIGKTGKEIREKGHEALIVSMYLLTNPHANMIGMYYLPIIYMAHETGLGLEGASKGLLRCIEAGFCHYDEDAEVVWVIEMAKYQIASSLKPSDNRCIGIQREYDSQPKNQFLSMFYDKYKDAFNLSSARESSIKNGRGLEGALKTLRSQEQEQEQEQDIKPPKSPLKKKSVQKRGFNILEEKIPDWLNPEVWEKWIEYRKEIKHPIKSKQTFSGQIKLLTECYELGFSPEEIISKTITNGWQGLFKPNVSPPQRIIQPQKNDEFIPEDF